jgi:hypothetical protein
MKGSRDFADFATCAGSMPAVNAAPGPGCLETTSHPAVGISR